MQMVSLETAKRLQELGVKWEPADTSVLPPPYVYRPRLDQVMDEIERLAPGDNVKIEFFHREGGQRRYCAVLRHHQTYADILGDGTGPNDTEAAGLALVKILEARNAAKMAGNLSRSAD